MMVDYSLHFALECVGQVILWMAFKHVCRHQWHRFAIWGIGTFLTSVLTVHLIG